MDFGNPSQTALPRRWSMPSTGEELPLDRPLPRYQQEHRRRHRPTVSGKSISDVGFRPLPERTHCSTVRSPPTSGLGSLSQLSNQVPRGFVLRDLVAISSRRPFEQPWKHHLKLARRYLDSAFRVPRLEILEALLLGAKHLPVSAADQGVCDPFPGGGIGFVSRVSVVRRRVARGARAPGRRCIASPVERQCDGAGYGARDGRGEVGAARGPVLAARGRRAAGRRSAAPPVAARGDPRRPLCDGAGVARRVVAADGSSRRTSVPETVPGTASGWTAGWSLRRCSGGRRAGRARCRRRRVSSPTRTRGRVGDVSRKRRCRERESTFVAVHARCLRPPWTSSDVGAAAAAPARFDLRSRRVVEPRLHVAARVRCTLRARDTSRCGATQRTRRRFAFPRRRCAAGTESRLGSPHADRAQGTEGCLGPPGCGCTAGNRKAVGDSSS